MQPTRPLAVLAAIHFLQADRNELIANYLSQTDRGQSEDEDEGEGEVRMGMRGDHSARRKGTLSLTSM